MVTRVRQCGSCRLRLRLRLRLRPTALGPWCAILEGVPLKTGAYIVDPPVVLAPMAGITNVAFRQLCREQGGGLFVCEMITTRALVERNPKTFRMIAFQTDERPRSLQLYGVDPETVRAAVRMVVFEALTSANAADMLFHHRYAFNQFVREALVVALDVIMLDELTD